MNAMFLKLLNMSVAGSVLILAVVVLRAVLKKAPRWIICVMWALVAIRLVCPISIASPVSAFRATPSIISESGDVEVFRPAGGSEKPLLAVDTVQIERPQASSETIREIPGTSYAVTQRSRDAYLPPLVTAYLLGLSAMLLYTVISTLLLRRKVAVSLRQRGNIRICDEVAGPFILGILRPVIYLPSSLSEEERRFVLAHERAHLRRLDHVWKPLGFLILSVHWFNPLCWLAYVLLCRDIELACDEKVIRELGRAERAAYSQTLLNCSAHRILAACPVAFGETDVKARVKAVLNYQKPAFWIVLAAVLGCIVLVACLMTKPSATKQLENAGHSETYDQNEFLPLYQDVLYKYRSVLINESFDDTYLMDAEVSELVEAFFGRDPLHRVGWALVDLDADFEPELVIGAVENEEMYGNILFGVYTLSDSKPVRLVQSSEPAHLYDLGDGMLLDEFSNSAEKHWILWRLNDGKLVFEDGLIYQSTWDDIEPWHQMEYANDWEIVPGQTIGEGKATAWIQKYQSRINHLKFTAFDSIDWASLPTAQLPEQSALPTPVPPPEGSGLSENAPAFVPADPEAFLLSFSSGKVIERIDYSDREYADSGKGFDEIISARTWTAHESRGFPASAPDRVVELLRDDFPQDPGWVLRFEESDGEMLCIAWQAYPFSDATWVLDCGKNLMDELMAWTTYEAGKPIEEAKPRMTLNDVYTLADKGMALTWADLLAFEGEEIGSGQLIWRFPISDSYCLEAYDGELDGPPEHVLLLTADENGEFRPGPGLYIDIFTQGIDTFLSGAHTRSITVTSGGETIEPSLYLLNEKLWTDYGWLVADGIPLAAALEDADQIPTLTLASDFAVRFAGYSRKSGLQVYDEQFKPLRENWYGDTAVNWLAPGSYYGVIEVFGPAGRYIASEGASEESVYRAVFRLNVDSEGAEPYAPEKAVGLTMASLHTIGEEWVLTDAARLARLETWLKNAEPLPGGAGCPFSSVLTLECADGSRISCCPAEDSCGVVFANGVYYRFAADNKDFWLLFGLIID